MKSKIINEISFEDDQVLNKKEIILFKYLNKEYRELNTYRKLINRISRLLSYFGLPSNDAKLYYNVYVQNYRPKGDYENLTKDEFVNLTDFKAKKTSNTNAYEYTMHKLPFKGSNLEGYWEINTNNENVYVVNSYGWYPIFLFKNNQWYEIDNRYSSSTGKHLNYANPVRYNYNSGLKNKVVMVSKTEMDKLLTSSYSLKDLKKDRLEFFLKSTIKKDPDVYKERTRTYWTQGGKIKAKFQITKIQRKRKDIIFDVNVIKAGNVVGSNTMEPLDLSNDSELPTDFKKRLENSIRNEIGGMYGRQIQDMNTIFNFNY
jgi:hypothetical protein